MKTTEATNEDVSMETAEQPGDGGAHDVRVGGGVGKRAKYGDQVPQSLRLFATKNQLGADELILSMDDVISASKNVSAAGGSSSSSSS